MNQNSRHSNISIISGSGCDDWSACAVIDDYKLAYSQIRTLEQKSREIKVCIANMCLNKKKQFVNIYLFNIHNTF